MKIFNLTFWGVCGCWLVNSAFPFIWRKFINGLALAECGESRVKLAWTMRGVLWIFACKEICVSAETKSRHRDDIITPPR